jgi:integrase
VRKTLARGLFNTLNDAKAKNDLARRDTLLEELRPLAGTYPDDAAVREGLARGLVNNAICLAIDTGMRSDELFGLQRRQVNSARNQIELTTGTKNSKPREIPLLPRAAEIVARLPVHLRSPYVLINPEIGTRYRQLNKGLAGAIKRAGIDTLTWHDLRRACGCRLLQDHCRRTISCVVSYSPGQLPPGPASG